MCELSEKTKETIVVALKCYLRQINVFSVPKRHAVMSALRAIDPKSELANNYFKTEEKKCNIHKQN